MSRYRIRLVCERGVEPVTGEALDREEETLTVEAATPYEGFRRATFRMTISPRGRLLRGYDADSGEQILPPAPGPFRRARFTIEGVQGPYEGYTTDETWNGWAIPYFPLAEARRIAADYAAQPPSFEGQTQGEYDQDRDVIRLYDPSAGEWDEVGPVVHDGRALYPIGARLWTWEEIE